MIFFVSPNAFFHSDDADVKILTRGVSFLRAPSKKQNKTKTKKNSSVQGSIPREHLAPGTAGRVPAAPPVLRRALRRAPSGGLRAVLGGTDHADARRAPAVQHLPVGAPEAAQDDPEEEAPAHRDGVLLRRPPRQDGDHHGPHRLPRRGAPAGTPPEHAGFPATEGNRVGRRFLRGHVRTGTLHRLR